MIWVRTMIWVKIIGFGVLYFMAAMLVGKYLASDDDDA